MASSATAQAGNGWGFWAGWGLAFLGFPLGGLAGLALAGPVTGVPQAALGGAATGAVIGAAHWNAPIDALEWLGHQYVALSLAGHRRLRACPHRQIRPSSRARARAWVRLCTSSLP